LEYLGSRRADPCNVLIGRLASNSVIESMTPLTTPEVQTDEIDEINSNLFDLLQRWTSLGIHWNRVNKEMATVFGKLKMQRGYQKGDLVVVQSDRLGTFSPHFARIANTNPISKNIEVFFFFIIN
jgi:hypothetical protein